MSIPQVGQGSVAVVPTFKGFRKTTDSVFGAAARSGKSIFDSGFTAAGLSAGKGFATSFRSTTKDLSSGALKGVQAEVAKASREVSTLRIREADALGKVRIAETGLAEARRKYAADSLQVVRAEERVAAAQRADIAVKERLLGATDRLTSAQRNLATATTAASDAGGRSGGVFGRLSATFGDAGRSGGARFSQGFKDVLGGVLGANILTGIGYTIGREIGDAARAGIGYTLQSVSLASDLEQSTGGVTAQFKDQAGDILTAAKTAATAVGLSRSTYQQYATVVGAQLKNLGIRQDQVSGKTIDLIALGADLAAQFGGPTSQAVEALSSLLRGERDPIERYGVSLKQADIDARLAAMGMSDLTGEAEKQATIQATLALLWEQTADAQGTFFREQDTYAGKQQRLMAQLTDAQTEFGNALLPTATQVLEFANDDLLPALKAALDDIGPELAASIEDSLPAIESALKSIAESVPEAIDLGTSISKALFGDENTQYGVDELVSDTNRVQKELEGFGEWLTRDFSTYKDWDDYWTTFGEGFTHWWDVAWDGVDDAAEQRAAETSDRMLSGFRDFLAQERGTEIGTEVGVQVGDAAIAAATAARPGMSAAGADVGEGFAQGLESKLARIDAAGVALGKGSIRAIRKGTESASPSKAAMRAGSDTGEGYGLGMLSQTDYVERSATALATASLASLRSLQPTGASVGASASPGASVPRELVIVDANRQLIGRMQVEADGRIAAYDAAASIENRMG